MKKILFIALTAIVALAVTSCVKDEQWPKATVSSISNSVAYSEADAVTVTVKANSLVGISGATLYYSVAGGAYTSVAMTGSNGTYTGTIPAGAAQIGQEVSYYAEVASAAGEVTKSAVNKYKVGEVPVDYTGLVLNELNGNDKFIELYNGGDHDIYIGGITMQKDGAEKITWTGPKQNIKKGEYLVLWSTDVKDAHSDVPAELFFDSGLSAKKAVQITIKKPSGDVIDDFNTTNSSAFAGSMGRNADGVWYYQDTKTPGAVNVDGTNPLPMK